MAHQQQQQGHVAALLLLLVGHVLLLLWVAVTPRPLLVLRVARPTLSPARPTGGGGPAAATTDAPAATTHRSGERRRLLHGRRRTSLHSGRLTPSCCPLDAATLCALLLWPQTSHRHRSGLYGSRLGRVWVPPRVWRGLGRSRWGRRWGRCGRRRR